MNGTDALAAPPPSPFPVDEWVRLRYGGSPPEVIAAHQGVTAHLVARLTDPYGPFPKPVQGPLQGVALLVARRVAGERVAAIAADLGLTHQQVSRATLPHGPFPRPSRVDQHAVAEWVAARRSGIPLARIARDARTTVRVVSAATKDQGPFPFPRRADPRWWTQAGIARRYGVPPQAVASWRAGRHAFPQPAPTPSRSPVWDPADVEAWATNHLHLCPACGAQVLDVPRHRGARHNG